MEEDELTLSFDKAGFFDCLGYKEFGIDIRSQKTVTQTQKRPDRFCRDDLGNTIFVFETKRPSDDEFFKSHNPMRIKWFSQLCNQYVLPTKATYGILTNGRRFTLFQRIGPSAVTKLDVTDIANITDDESRSIESFLQKPDSRFQTVKEIRRYIESDKYNGLRIDDALDEFYDSYKLIPESHFGKLLVAVYTLFQSEYNKDKNNFTTVAFDFWAKSYSAKPKEAIQRV